MHRDHHGINLTTCTATKIGHRVTSDASYRALIDPLDVIILERPAEVRGQLVRWYDLVKVIDASQYAQLKKNTDLQIRIFPQRAIEKCASEFCINTNF